MVDILNFKIIKFKKIDKNLIELRKMYKTRDIPKLPLGADLLMKKYHLSEGKQLGVKLKIIEEEWVKNNFQITDQQIDSIINN